VSFILKQKKKGDKLSRVNKVTDEEINNYVVDYNSGMSCTEIVLKLERNMDEIKGL
jgi:GTP cyclohydrolase FolE2